MPITKIHFKDSKTKAIFEKTMKSLVGNQQTSFAKEVKAIADKKLVADEDFTVNVDDLRTALGKTSNK